MKPPEPNWHTVCPGCGERWEFSLDQDAMEPLARDGLSALGRALIERLGVCGDCRGLTTSTMSIHLTASP